MQAGDFLAECDGRFDSAAGLIGMTFISPGYHTRVPAGQWVHATVHNFEYAILLLRRARGGDVERAANVLQVLLGLQEKNPVAATYGIWPWLLEEPLSRMSPPDWNWADFCGGRICELLADHAAQLPDRLCAMLRESLAHAAGAIFRRNVKPDYTNISVMGAGVCAAAGELLNQRWLLQYGARRVQACVEHTQFHGGLNEYNSPSYTTILIQECERVLAIVSDPAVRVGAEWLRQKAWETISEHFHPATGQWAGPHCRAYENRVDRSLADFLEERTGIRIEAAPGNPAAIWTGPINVTVKPLPCPSQFVPAFRDPVGAAVQRVRRFVRHASDDRLSAYGTTWMTDQAALGSISRGVFWAQQKPVIGYWKTPQEQAVVLRVRFLHDGRDFCSAVVRTAQKDSRLLSSINLATDMGDFAWLLDRPGPEGFSISDLRLRCQIIGRGVSARQDADDRYVLWADPWSATLYTPPSQYGPWKVRWELAGTDGDRWLDGICYQGDAIPLQAERFGEIRLGVGIELSRVSAPVRVRPLPTWSLAIENKIILQWDELQVEAPRLPETYLKDLGR